VFAPKKKTKQSAYCRQDGVSMFHLDHSTIFRLRISIIPNIGVRSHLSLGDPSSLSIVELKREHSNCVSKHGTQENSHQVTNTRPRAARERGRWPWGTHQRLCSRTSDVDRADRGPPLPYRSHVQAPSQDPRI
jgi:hypothetical protein